MISRLGNAFTPPKWFLDSEYSESLNLCTPQFALELPNDITLDGELFGGRGEFQSTVSIVKTINSPHWQGITFQVNLFLTSRSLIAQITYDKHLIDL
jgi:DNA ligase 1